MRNAIAASILGLAALAGDAFGAAPELPPPYAPPAVPVSGRISIWGHGALAGVSSAELA